MGERNTRPNLYHNPSFGTEYREAERVSFAPTKTVEPARDTRYPAYAGPMSDGRLVTDYRPQCSRNIAPQDQYTTKLWMVHHAEDIIRKSRERQTEWSGASLPMANTVPPPADIVHSTPFYSEVVPTQIRTGVGVERADSKAPELFGTFYYEPSMKEIQSNVKKISMTKHYEGGRNTPRGIFLECVKGLKDTLL